MNTLMAFWNNGKRPNLLHCPQRTSQSMPCIDHAMHKSPIKRRMGTTPSRYPIKRMRMNYDHGSRGDVFVRQGERGAKLFKAHETMQEGKHNIEPNLGESERLA